MIKTLLFILVALLVFQTASSQDPVKPALKHEIGMAAGMSTGVGISYRYWPGKFGFQFTTTPNFEKDQAQASFGLTGLMKLTEISWLRFFLYLGNHYLYEKWEYYDYDMNGNPTESYTEIQQRYVVGIGPGFEFLIGKKISLNVMFGFRSDWRSTGNYMIGFTGETGLYYRF